MTHLLGELAFAVMAGLAFIGGIYLSAALALIISGSLLAAVVTHGERFDTLDRVCLCGLAGSMLLTTPSIFIPHSPYADWSFNLSRFFLCALVVKRFLIPAYWATVSRLRSEKNGRERYRDVL